MLMANNKRTYDSYPRDEFDDPPQGPIGVHRGKPSLASRLTPYLIVLVVAVLAGLLVWSMLSGGLSNVMPWNREADTGSEATTSETTSESNDDTTDGEGGESTEGSEGTESPDSGQTDQGEQTDVPTEGDQDAQGEGVAAAAVNKATAVRVVNAAGINGYAASKAKILEQAGFTNVTAANPSGSVPESTVVWYENEADAATAQEVATQLGITSVSQQSGISSAIVVVLRD